MDWPALCLLLVALGQAAPAAAPSPTNEELAAAIESLAHDDFHQREAAMDRLWRAGDEAEQALQAAQKSEDPEVRLRAALVLQQFRKGIYADTPRESVVAIEMFHRSVKLRSEAIRRLRTAGDWRSIMRLLRMASADGERDELASSLAAELPRLINDRLLQEDYSSAAELMEYQAGPRHDSQRRIAFLWLQTGQLEERIAPLAAKPKRTADEALQLATYYEIRGDFAEARQAAEGIDDPRLQLRLASRDGDWAAAARWHDALPTMAEETDVKSLAVSAAWHKLARNDELYRARLQSLQDLAAAGNGKDALLCAESLLILGETDAGLANMVRLNPTLALELYAARHQYDEALSLANIEETTQIDADWFDGLPLMPTSSELPLLQRFRLAAAAARTLHRLGDEQRVAQITDLLGARLEWAFTEVGKLPKKPRPGVPRDKADPPADLEPAQKAALEKLSARLRQLIVIRIQSLQETGREDEAVAAAEQWIARGQSPTVVLPPLFPEVNSGTVRHYWNQLKELATAERLAQLRLVLTPGSPEGEAAIRRIGRDIPPAAGPGFLQPSLSTALALASLHQRDDLALEILENMPTKSFQTFHELGARQLARGDLAGAEASYRALIKAHPGAAYHGMLAIVLGRQGKAEEEARQRVLSLLLASHSTQYSQLVSLLSEHASAAEMREYLLPLWRWNKDFNLLFERSLGNKLAETEPLEAVTHFETVRRQLLERSGVHVTEPTDYLHVPHTICRLRARGLLAAGRQAEAQRELAQCRAIMPVSSERVEAIVPLLQAAGEKAAADELFASVISAHEKIVDRWPESAWHRNAIAWTSARCQRRLDEALAHALEATKLRPAEAPFVDTLAEVYFTRGDVDKAIATQRRAVELAPGNPLFAQRLKEFEAAARGEKVERTFAAPSDEI